MASAKSRLADMYHSAEHFLADMPIAKAIGGVIANPTPQELGAQISNLGSSVSDTLQEATKDPMSAALNFTPMGMGTIYKGFHGTDAVIKQFDKSFLGSATGAKSAKQGFWFVDNPKVAEGYATYAAETAPVKKLLDKADTYERIAQKPGNEKYWAKQDEAVRQAEELEKNIGENRFRGQNIIPANLDIKNPKILDAKGESFVGMEQDINEAIRKAKADGNDGLVIKNLDDAANFSNMPATHYLVFEPKQIKSGITNLPMSAEDYLDK